VTLKSKLRKYVFIVVALVPTVLILGGCSLLSQPHAQFTVDPAWGYPPLVVHFDASNSTSQNGAIISYSWDFGDGTTDKGALLDHTFYNKGAYEVTLTVVDCAGATGKATHSVEVLNHAPTALFTVTPYIPQRKTETSFDATTSNDQDGYITTWQWDFGDATTKSGKVVSHIYELAGSYEVTLIVIDNNGKEASLTKEITVAGCNTCQ
jgi:chitinase